MGVTTPPSLDLACPQAKAEIEKYVHMFCSDQTSNSLISVLRCHPWISNADTTQYSEDL